MEIKDFEKISPFRWRLGKNFDKTMNVDAEIFATEEILQTAIDDASIQQVINVASLPGIHAPSLAMPDIHFGYGFSIGGVAAFPAETGIVSPGGVGYDINCGVRCLTTNLNLSDVEEHLDVLGHSILRDIPTGMTSRSNLKLSKKQFMGFIKNGAREVFNHISGNPSDLEYIESGGSLPFTMPEIISDKALERGKNQIGSLGSGNHFIEIQLIDEIFDQKTADVFGLRKGQITVMIHTGSRGFGHQIATDYIERLRRKNLKKIKIKDPQLIYADIQSKEGKHYLEALNGASNFAWANRHMLMETIITILEYRLGAGREKLGISLLYDQAHNIAKFESHDVGGQKQKLLVHRKGATRAFPPGHPELPARYKATGQPVLIPGSMGSASYILKGTGDAMKLTFGSSAHGAGRQMSRSKAIKFAADTNVRQSLKERNILAFCISKRGLKEEIPEAYKDIDEVIEVTAGAGISQKVARLVPLVVVKG